MGRRTYNGPIRNAERTKEKLISAVGKVLRKEGYPGLKSLRIAKAAKLNSKLIPYYFGSVENLIGAYIRSKDYWNNFPEDVIAKISASDELSEDAMVAIIAHQFDFMCGSPDMQKMVHWQLGDENDVLREIMEEREVMADVLFRKADGIFKGTDIDFRAMSAILVGGIYSVLLHTFNGVGGTFCGLDLRNTEDRERLNKELSRIISAAYKSARSQKGKNKNGIRLDISGII